MNAPSVLTNVPSIKLRFGSRSLNYIRLIRQMTVSKTGYYSFQISCSFPTNVLLYSNSFNASDPLLNLIAQSESDADGQVKLTTLLQGGSRLLKRVRLIQLLFDQFFSKIDPSKHCLIFFSFFLLQLIQKRAVQSYYLIVTTQDKSASGSVSISLNGPSGITIIDEDNAIITITSKSFR